MIEIVMLIRVLRIKTFKVQFSTTSHPRAECSAVGSALRSGPVSYTHLDVYKRQVSARSISSTSNLSVVSVEAVPFGRR